MKTLEQIMSTYENQEKEVTLDGRDLHRLAQFVPEDQLHRIGVTLKDEYVGKHEHVPFTRENVLKQLEEDLHFAAQKARNQRGISAGIMHDVVMMWNWVLEEGLEDDDEYGSYGIPLFRKTAEKYNIDIDIY